jgi:rubrerythrin
MNILEFAREKEQFSIDLYTQLSGRAAYEGLKNVFAMLAEEEKKHYQVVTDMMKKAPVHVLETPILMDASKTFVKMKEGAEHFVFPDSEIEAYKKARNYEEESRQFYLAQASEATDPEEKDVLKRLAEEEHKHLVLLDNICDFVVRPLYYLENAEINHLQHYMEDRAEAEYHGEE